MFVVNEENTDAVLVLENRKLTSFCPLNGDSQFQQFDICSRDEFLFTQTFTSLMVLFSAPSAPEYCCLQFFRIPVNKNLVSSYYLTDPRCPISAVVLITSRARRICVDGQQLWVKKIIEHLENISR
uniref:Chemokine interleukin-8-like domain-containing protein n=1 Tax=Xiphophorus maculatus TaxID=8083 RepID=A0A3B5QJL4_XIPMA